MALQGSMSVPYGLSKLNPQLTSADLIKISELRKSKEYSDWSDLFRDFLTSKGIEIPSEHLPTV